MFYVDIGYILLTIVERAAVNPIGWAVQRPDVKRNSINFYWFVLALVYGRKKLGELIVHPDQDSQLVINDTRHRMAVALQWISEYTSVAIMLVLLAVNSTHYWIDYYSAHFHWKPLSEYDFVVGEFVVDYIKLG